jgi:predicted negative regulator of RcsB-dependent stress response
VVAYNTDEEQIEALKNWWSENGTQLMVGLIVALTAVFGYQSWQGSVREDGEAASALYEDLRAAISTGRELSEVQITTARYLADTLIKDHEASAYAKFAAMQMAKLSVEQGELDQAEKDLRWVMDHADDTTQSLARLRLARVLFARGDQEGALALIETVDEGAYKSSYSEVRGDFYNQMGRPAEARQAYQTALNELQEAGSNPLLQMKLDDVSVSEGSGSVAEDTEQQEPSPPTAESASEPVSMPVEDQPEE